MTSLLIMTSGYLFYNLFRLRVMEDSKIFHYCVFKVHSFEGLTPCYRMTLGDHKSTYDTIDLNIACRIPRYVGSCCPRNPADGSRKASQVISDMNSLHPITHQLPISDLCDLFNTVRSIQLSEQGIWTKCLVQMRAVLKLQFYPKQSESGAVHTHSDRMTCLMHATPISPSFERDECGEQTINDIQWRKCIESNNSGIPYLIDKICMRNRVFSLTLLLSMTELDHNFKHLFQKRFGI